MGSIRYYIDRATNPEAIYARYWQEVALISSDGLNAQNEKALSTTLLVTPNFGLRNREYFEVWWGSSGRWFLVGVGVRCWCWCAPGIGRRSPSLPFIHHHYHLHLLTRTHTHMHTLHAPNRRSATR
jgi:hypothetical protein